MGFQVTAVIHGAFVLGELDVKMLGVLQSTLPDVPITAEIVDCSSELTDIFKGITATDF